MSRGTPLDCPPSNPLQSNCFQLRNIEYRIGLCTSSKYILYSRSKLREKHIFPPFCFKVQNKLCTHDDNRKRAEVWVKKKVRRLNRSRYVVELNLVPRVLGRERTLGTRVSRTDRLAMSYLILGSTQIKCAELN